MREADMVWLCIHWFASYAYNDIYIYIYIFFQAYMCQRSYMMTCVLLNIFPSSGESSFPLADESFFFRFFRAEGTCQTWSVPIAEAQPRGSTVRQWHVKCQHFSARCHIEWRLHAALLSDCTFASCGRQALSGRGPFDNCRVSLYQYFCCLGFLYSCIFGFKLSLYLYFCFWGFLYSCIFVLSILYSCIFVF